MTSPSGSTCGELQPVGDSLLAAVIRVVLAGTRPLQAALVTLGERSKAETDEALRAVQELVATRPVREYVLHVEAAGMSFAEAVRAVVSRRRGVPVELRQRFSADGETIESPPFGGLMISEDHGPGDDTSSGWFLYDCHSHWYSNVKVPLAWPGNHYTICHGPCKGTKVCCCDAAKNQWADGWLFCKCR